MPLFKLFEVSLFKHEVQHKGITRRCRWKKRKKKVSEAGTSTLFLLFFNYLFSCLKTKSIRFTFNLNFGNSIFILSELKFFPLKNFFIRTFSIKIHNNVLQPCFYYFLIIFFLALKLNQSDLPLEKRKFRES